VADAASFYTGLVADLYRELRGGTPDVAMVERFVRRHGEPALDLGCGDGDPILELRAAGLDVEGLDASPDMLRRCAAAAAERGLTVTLHEARFETMALGRTYRSIYAATSNWNLLPTDDHLRAAFVALRAHLHPDGAALLTFFVPERRADPTGWSRRRVLPDGTEIAFTVLGVDRDESARTEIARLRYERIRNGEREQLERDWCIHWASPDALTEMAEDAGLVVRSVRDAHGAAGPASTEFALVVAKG
jgi:cyclopropane fatty-acyl-phospholipid synthase-like methyltransferase